VALKNGGAGSMLYPPDVTSILEVPADLAMCIEQAFRICSWQENLQEDEMPPKWMWHLEWELETWFAEVDQARKDKYGGDADDDREETQMMGNDLARERFGR
jgi:hypothetical protein